MHRILLAILSATFVLAQTPSKAPLAFEVASIKPNKAGDNRVGMGFAPGGRMNVSGASLRMLIRTAYRIQDSQISGGPTWMDSERYDITAKAEDNATQAQTLEMLQTLLAERFKLKIHHETKELPVYALLVGKNGPKMTESARTGGGPSNRIQVGRGLIDGAGMSMANLVQTLSNQIGRTVLDQTGLKGNYDFKLEWMPEGAQIAGSGDRGGPPAPAGDSPLPSIFTAVQEQLGLRLETQKGPVDTIVVDSAEMPNPDGRR